MLMVFNFGAEASDESILYCSDENGMEIRITIEEKVEIIVKKYQIFVGSTYNDLIEERQTAIRAIMQYPLSESPAGDL